MIEWITSNADKIGAAIVGFGTLYAAVKKILSGDKKEDNDKKAEPNKTNNPTHSVQVNPSIQINPNINPNIDNNSSNNVTLNNYLQAPIKDEKSIHDSNEDAILLYKSKTRILFIDDDSKFKVVNILKTAGWNNTKSIKDLKSLDSEDAREAHIFFVDIQGVGKSLDFGDEGLGLAHALKLKYPNKKVIIYSSDQNGTRFHKAFNVVDYQLYKNAEPYEFINIVEQFSIEIFS